MLVLTFRDMTTARCSAVTTAAMFRLDPVDAAMAWAPTPPPLKLATWSDVGSALAGKHVCFLIHGFNVDRDQGYTSYGPFSQELGPGRALPGAPLPNPPGPVDLFCPGVDVVIPVLWAGDSYLPINYPFLLPDIRLTGKYFAQLLASSDAQMSRVSFVTHSMGARVMFEAVQQAVVAAQAGGWRLPVFDTAVLTAPAVSDQVFDDPDYAAAVDAMQNFVVVSSRADTVLSGWFPLGNAVEQALWRNDPGADDALGRYGPRLQPDSKALGKTRWFEIPIAVGQNHGDYCPAPWDPTAGFPNGWSSKSVPIGALAQAILDRETPAWPPAKPVTAVG